MFDKFKSLLKGAASWLKSLIARHDSHLEKMVASALPMVIKLATRKDLSGDEKRKALMDAILDNAELDASEIGTSMINEAIEVAANRYNLELGKLTKEKMDNALDAVVKAGRDFADEKLKLDGSEAEKAGLPQP